MSLAVANSSPSGLSWMALRGDEWAGMMLTLPDPTLTSWTCPGVRPGKARTLSEREQRPRELSAVSYTDTRLGGFSKL